MTNEQLKTLILSDAQATAFCESQNFRAAAARCGAIAPKITKEVRATELTLLWLYASPAAAEAVLQQIESVAVANPVVARVVKWLQPGAPGIDLGDARVRFLLTLPIQDGGIGLTEEQAAPLLAVAEQSQEFTPTQVREAYNG